MISLETRLERKRLETTLESGSKEIVCISMKIQGAWKVGVPPFPASTTMNTKSLQTNCGKVESPLYTKSFPSSSHKAAGKSKGVKLSSLKISVANKEFKLDLLSSPYYQQRKLPSLSRMVGTVVYHGFLGLESLGTVRTQSIFTAKIPSFFSKLRGSEVEHRCAGPTLHQAEISVGKTRDTGQ
jgi:hypothetical protein